MVRRFVVTGSTRWSESQLRRDVLAPFEGRVLDSETLEQARRALTEWYVQHGHPNSGAVVPDQDVVDGVVRIEIVEGRLSEVRITGNRALRAAYLAERIERAAGTPLSLPALLDSLRLLQDVPAIESIHASFGPGERPGDGRMRIEVVEAPPWQAGLVVANNRSPSVGSVRTQLLGVHRSLTGRGDVLAARYGVASGLDDVGLEYSLPLRADDTALTLRADSSDAAIVESPFRDLDIRSRTRVLALGISRPLRQGSDAGVLLGTTLERKRSDTFLLGERFSFSPGVQDGRSVVTVLRASSEWYRRSARDAFALRAIVGVGLDAFGATVGPSPDGRFVDAQLQLQWAHRLSDDGAQAFFRIDAQWSRDALLPLEKFAVGGASSVRGYRENLLIRDQGIVGSAELRRPLARFTMPGIGGAGDARLQGAVFADAGGGSNRDAVTPSPRWIASIGAALRLSVGRNLLAELQYGHALKSVAGTGSDLQDRGIHFRLALQTD